MAKNKCPSCPKSFNTREKLKKHEINHLIKKSDKIKKNKGGLYEKIWEFLEDDKEKAKRIKFLREIKRINK